MIVCEIFLIKTRLLEIRMNRTIFELIRENAIVERGRLMILVIVGRRTDEHCFRREVGMGSKSQVVSGESVSIVQRFHP